MNFSSAASGDAYKGRFGYHEIAGTNTDPAHGQINYRGSNVQNNLDNRLKVLADNIKNEGTATNVVALNIAISMTSIDCGQSPASPRPTSSSKPPAPRIWRACSNRSLQV